MDVNALFQIVTDALNNGIKVDVFAIMAGCVGALIIIAGGKLIMGAIMQTVNRDNENGIVKDDDEHEGGIR